jgi:hypothetical protein
LEKASLRVPAQYVYIREIALFNMCSSSQNYPSSRHASTARIVCRDIDVVGTKSVFVYCDSAVGIATGYEPDYRQVGVQVPVGSRIFSTPSIPDLELT